MAAPGLQPGVLEVDVHGVLLVHDRGHGLERDPKVDRFAVRDPTLDPTGTVGHRPDFAPAHAKRVVVLPAGEQDPAEPGPDVEPFGGRQTKHRLAEVGFQSIEDRFTPARRNAPGDAFHNPAHTVTRAAGPFDETD